MNEMARKLMDYHVWANDQYLKHLRNLPDELFVQQVESVFPSIAHALGHMVTADRIWMSRIGQVSPGKLGESPLSTIEEAERQFAEVGEAFKHLLLQEQDVTRWIDYRNLKGDPFRQPIMEIIQHVVNHGTYHRGNMTAMLRQMGYPGASTDYITFVRLG